MGIILKENSYIEQYDDSMERIRKEKEYLDYIIEHINFVKKAYVLYMVPLLDQNNISTLISDEELKDAIEEVALRIETHDASKFSDSEFDGYRVKYYPTKRENQESEEFKQEVGERYEECWKHHYTVNKHHPEHWLDHKTGVCTDMTLDAIVEMLCDWEAMSLKFNTNTVEWYKNEAIDEKKAFSLNTKAIVEDLLFNILHKDHQK